MADAQAAYLWQAQGGLGAQGAMIGRDMEGASFAFDPYRLYQAKVVGNPNILVAGDQNYGKSTLAKSLALRLQVFGRKTFVVDRKHEYDGFARALGVRPIALAPGGSVTLNPLTPSLDVESRQRLIRAVASSALGRNLSPGETAAVREAVAAAIAYPATTEATLRQVVDALLHPTAEHARAVGTDLDAARVEARDVGLGLDRLVRGDLAGMFDGPTTPGVGFLATARAVVLDISKVPNEGLPIAMACATAWLQGQAREGDKRVVIIDEAWKLLNSIWIGEWLQESFKLSRASGTSHMLIMHRVSDLDTAGPVGSRERALAEGLIKDCATRILYHQESTSIGATASLLGLSDRMTDHIGNLSQGHALWLIGARAFIVHHLLTPAEKAITDTDAAMRD